VCLCEILWGLPCYRSAWRRKVDHKRWEMSSFKLTGVRIFHTPCSYLMATTLPGWKSLKPTTDRLASQLSNLTILDSAIGMFSFRVRRKSVNPLIRFSSLTKLRCPSNRGPVPALKKGQRLQHFRT